MSRLALISFSESAAILTSGISIPLSNRPAKIPFDLRPINADFTPFSATQFWLATMSFGEGRPSRSKFISVLSFADFDKAIEVCIKLLKHLLHSSSSSWFAVGVAVIPRLKLTG